MANKSICGMQCFVWSEQDSVMAAGQATQKANEEAALNHPRVAHDAAHAARVEVLNNQVERDRSIIVAMRCIAVKPGWNNQRLVAYVFSLGWESAKRHCIAMRIDPEGRTSDGFVV